jgi:hypothetical protein
VIKLDVERLEQQWTIQAHTLRVMLAGTKTRRMHQRQWRKVGAR